MKLLVFGLTFTLLSFASDLEGKNFGKPLREVSIIQTDEGYYPKSFSVHEGENIRFFITSTTKTPGCFVVENHQVFMAAEIGKMSEKEIVFKEPGKFKYYCPSTKHSGYITVIESVRSGPTIQTNNTERDFSRSISGNYENPENQVWIPKDY